MRQRFLWSTVVCLCFFMLIGSAQALCAKSKPKAEKSISIPAVAPEAPNEPEEKPRIVLPPLKAALKLGMEGQDIELVQKRLQGLGYYRGAVDGLFGSATLNAVFIFQLNNGLYTDGIVGNETVKTLNLPDDKIKTPSAADVSRGGARKGAMLVAQASGLLGVPYVWGGIGPNGFDCSGFIYYLLKGHGVTVPRMADGQFTVGVPVDRGDLQAGDLVFFSTYEPGPSHVGIYMGDGNFIHASSAARQVTITSLGKAYYVERYLGARRLLP